MVVDASVLLKWFVEEEGSAAARRLITRHALFAPDLALAELANALWASATAGRFESRLAGAALDKAAHLLDLVPSAPILERAFAMAVGLRHPVYDCLYLAAAEIAATQVVTADTRFQRAAAGSPWAALVLPLNAL
jgi:predicted nucleic acid-binding protein